jgi:hypothetical protein
LFIFDFLLNILDWATSFLGYGRGGGEGDLGGLVFTRIFGDYVGVSILKILTTLFVLGGFWFMRNRWRKGNPILAIVVVLLFLLLGVSLVRTVAENLNLLGV